jgi:hypothetical protein
MFWLEVLGGARRVPHPLLRWRWYSLALAFWWVVLLLLALGFAGRTTKFIYVDF